MRWSNVQSHPSHQGFPAVGCHNILHTVSLEQGTLTYRMAKYSWPPVPCGLYYKTIMIVIMTIVSNATIWSVNFDDAS
jgi:hypothetical protein